MCADVRSESTLLCPLQAHLLRQIPHTKRIGVAMMMMEADRTEAVTKVIMEMTTRAMTETIEMMTTKNKNKRK
jgi:hypothetical protein